MSGFGYDVLGFGSGAGAVPPEVDDKFNLTTLLAKFDGANNGVNNAFDDGSTSNHTITAAGNVAQGSFSPFSRPEGHWAVDFYDKTALALPASSTDFDFGTANFTIECFMLYKGNPSSDDSYIISFGGGSGNAGHFGLNIYNGNWRSGAFNNDLSAGTAPTDRAWHHVAQVYESNVFKLYVDGTLVSSVGSSGPFNTTTGAVIGGYWNDSDANNWNGLISNLRIVKGTAVYTSNFTPPTGPLTAISGTVLLACQSNHFVDNSASAHFLQTVPQAYETWTAKVTARGPFLTDAAYDPAVNGASAYFDGSGDWLVASSGSTDFGFGTGDFTLEFWIYPNRVSSQSVLSMLTTTTDTAPHIYLENNLRLYDGSGTVIASSTLSATQWYHVAVCRSSSSTKMFINGSQAGSTFSDSNNYGSSKPCVVGSYYNNGSVTSGSTANSIISDVRVLKGTAVYTSDFTPPTAPLTAITNTKLLLNMADGQAIDSAAQNNLLLYGGAKLSTSEVLFGTTSAYFDGTAFAQARQVLLGPYPENFTVEFWYYGLNAGNVQQLVAQYNSGNATGRMGLNYIQTGTAGVELSLHGSTTLTMRAAAPQGQWVHVALTRSMNDFVIYINGTSGATGTSANTIYGTNTTIGGSVALTASGYDFKGYMSNLRITKALRYTGNFTAPDKPFPSQGQL